MLVEANKQHIGGERCYDDTFDSHLGNSQYDTFEAMMPIVENEQKIGDERGYDDTFGGHLDYSQYDTFKMMLIEENKQKISGERGMMIPLGAILVILNMILLRQ